MMPLIILLLSFTLFLVLGRMTQRISANKAGRIAFGLMFVFTGVSHFTFTKGMMMSMPAFIPFKEFFVYLTGVIEVLFAVFFLMEKYKRFIARLIIAFLIVVLPANIWAAIYHVDIPSATYTGPGLAYLWFRIPLQLFFIAWVYHFGINPIFRYSFKENRQLNPLG